MKVDTAKVANIFNEMADFLSIKGENPFRVRAYQKAADALEHLSGDLGTLYHQGKLQNIAGIGKGMLEKIETILETGKLPAYEQLKKKIPEGLGELLSIPEVGPKTVKVLYEKGGVENIEDLEKFVHTHKLRNFPGMGAKTEENILRGIKLYRSSKGRILLGRALPLVEKVIAELKSNVSPCIEKISPAGSLRRGKETIGDIDILVSSSNSSPIMDVFTHLSFVKEVLAKGKTKSSILTEEDLQIDLRVVSPDSFGSALQYFTGSKSHNIELREKAIRRGLKINEYGVFTQKGEKLAGRNEEDIYASLDLPLIPPELREDRGEIEAGERGELPGLLKEEEIKGDLHIHTKASDGANSIEELVKKAKQKRYEYIAITDHSSSLKIAGGLSEDTLLQQINQIKEINSRLQGFKVFAGSEVDIRKDGSLDYSDETLKKLDIVIAAVHTSLKQDKKTMTDRVIKSLCNPFVRIFAHPTGRLLGEREAYSIDLDKVLQVAQEKNIWIEINAQPQRLDLTDLWIKEAKKRGIKLVINTDAHHLATLDFMLLGVLTARRGWLEKKDVVNTLSLNDFLTLLSL
ncbi:MAG: DNA polymerase/3'-5' exonuclease PolX [Candidatus Aerophobetes bacterium]|nr:DNA polymerase/3'-5' exonuclease PolX [Candidatus Aerophobetes bacterium]